MSSFEFNFHAFDNGPNLVVKGLRWTDFSATHDRIEVSRRGGDVKEYGREPTESHLVNNNLSGIIRGHQDFHHCALLSRIDGSSREMEVIPANVENGNGMLYPPTFHWRGLDSAHWEKISISDVFKDFSVVTTSTAVRARGALGYHTYLEVMSVTSEINQAQRSLQHASAYINFFDELGLGDKYRLIMNAEYGDVFDIHQGEKIKWDSVIDLFKEQPEGYAFTNYGIVVMDSYNMFRVDESPPPPPAIESPPYVPFTQTPLFTNQTPIHTNMEIELAFGDPVPEPMNTDMEIVDLTLDDPVPDPMVTNGLPYTVPPANFRELYDARNRNDLPYTVPQANFRELYDSSL